MNYKLFKKLDRSVLALLFMFLGLISCYDSGYDEFIPPTGNVNNIQPNTLFTTSTSADDTMSFVFRSYSTDAASYLWDFGDGNTSTDANPNYTYAVGGLYTVKLTTKSSEGLVAEDSSEVAPLFLDFDFTIVDSEVTFQNLSSGANSLVWNFGDEETLEWDSEDTEDDADFSPVHVYKTAETFVATLTATNFLGASVSVSKNIEGLVLSTVPDFTFAVSGFTVNFTDASVLAVSYSWDFGDGTTSTEQNPTHIYAGEGSYDVILTTTNEAGVSKSITIGVPVGGIQATFAAVILNGTMDEFTANKDDNNDAWETDPPNSLKDGSDSPYLWDNKGLRDDLGLKAAGITTSANTGSYALKFSSNDRRAYQPFAVEVGVEYTVSMFVRTETGDNFNVYMLNNEAQDENDLAGNSDAVYTVSGNPNSYVEHTFTFRASSSTAVFYAVPDSGISGDSEVYLDDISIQTPGFDASGQPTGVTATFAAAILNGTMDEFTANKDDNNDAWETDPPNTLKDGSDSPYLWDNTGLRDGLGLKAAGITTSANFGTYALKFSSNDRRAYQPFAVETGVEYTISMYVRTESADDFNIYILNNEVQDENDLAGNSDVVYTVSGNPNSYVEHTFSFIASSSNAVFYAVPSSGINGDSEVYLDDISIETPGF